MANQPTGASDFADSNPSILSIALSPTFDNDQTCYAAGPDGLYRSIDAGQTWRSVTLPAPNIPVLALALAPDAATLFCGSQGGVLRSSDAGQHWEISLLPPPEPTVVALALSPAFAQDNLIFAGTDGDGMFRSADGGNTWNPWNFGLLDTHVLSLAISPDFANDLTLFAGTSSGLFISRNSGRSWSETTFPIDMAPVISFAISPQFASDHILYAGTEANGLFMSSDQGQSWSDLGSVQLQGSINSIAIDRAFPATPTLTVASNDAIYRSHDRGASWEVYAPIADALALVVPYGTDDEQPILVGRAEGGVQWVRKTKQINTPHA